MSAQRGKSIAHCARCDWRGVPTIQPKRGRFKGIDPIGGFVWAGRGKETGVCPCCGARHG